MIELFAGIGAFSVAAERCGIRTVAFVEINPFCRKVLAARFPGVPILEDVKTVTAESLQSRGVGRIDILSGGWPCQGNSVAGLRGGHADDRSGLFSEILRLLDELRPQWFILENVPGLVSVNGGLDFADVIGELRRRDYVGCVRRLDAQHYGLAQRRSRLFFVGGLGAAGRRAIHAVLEGGRRYPAPRREAGQRAPTIPSRNTAGGGLGTDFDCDGGLIVPPLTGNPYGDHASREGMLVTHTLTANGFDASEDGTGRGTPLIARQVTSKTNRSNPQPGDPCCTLHEGGAAIAFNPQSGGSKAMLGIGEIPTAIGCTQTPAVAFGLGSHSGAADGNACNRSHASGGPVGSGISEELAQSIRSERVGGVATRAQVRRLSPTECERLMGVSWQDPQTGEWLDGHTCLCGLNRGRSFNPDGGEVCKCPYGPRYRSLGNSLAVQVAEWLFAKIVAAAE